MTDLLDRFRRMALVGKLLLLSLLFTVPLGLLGNLFVTQSLKDIRFAEREREGVEHLAIVWPLLGAALKTGALPGSPDRFGPLADDPRYREAVGAASAATDPVAGVATLRQLVATISDRSNLTLDPDLDSYYVMDAVVFKLPELADATAAFQAAVGAAEADPVRRAVTLALAERRLATAMEASAASFASAYAGNADGSLKPALDPLVGGLGAAVGAVTAAAGDPAGLAAARAAADRPADAAWTAAAGELTRLLDVRLAGFWSNLFEKLAVAVGVTLAILALVGVVSRDISRSIGRITGRMRRLADGELDEAVPYVGQPNELGAIAASVVVFRDALSRIDRFHAEREEEERRAAALRRADVVRLAAAFEDSVGGIARIVASAAMQLEASAHALTESANAASTQSGSVATATEAAAGRMQAVSAATEELSSSVGEISRQTRSQADLTTRASAQADDTGEKVRLLVELTQAVDGIVETINEIAAQTNLLALNATIEASRAGDAGQGFSVVAGEVKQLADQTERATARIAAQVTEIRGRTGEVDGAIGEIRAVIQDVSGISAAIAASVEQQGAAADEIARNVQSATRDTAVVSRDVNRISRAAGDSVSSASEVLKAARELARQAETLNAEVFHFLETVRAA